jgi:hypothetical protein
MTSTIGSSEVFKQDVLGRVRVPRQRREALLDEFDKSGASGAKFARLAGIKYPTFANWVQKRRKDGTPAQTGARVRSGVEDSPAGGGPIRLFEALVEGGGAGSRNSAGEQGLRVELPGGSRILVESPVQLQMAAELVALIAQNARARC